MSLRWCVDPLPGGVGAIPRDCPFWFWVDTGVSPYRLFIIPSSPRKNTTRLIPTKIPHPLLPIPAQATSASWPEAPQKIGPRYLELLARASLEDWPEVPRHLLKKSIDSTGTAAYAG
ncbi:MAG: hypothetical protein V8K32_10370 [Candidatus Electrothrix gigas]